MQIPKDLIKEAEKKLQSVKNKSEFYNLRSHYLGKKSFVQNAFKELKNLDGKEKIKIAKSLNHLRSKLTDFFESVDLKVLTTKEEPYIDVTLPVNSNIGKKHPISVVMDLILDYFHNLNYSSYFGNEIESDYYNFEALNFPQNHPARQMHDTFYLNKSLNDKCLLRTHTSNTQIHMMLNKSAPIYMLSPGRVYRCDHDMTHLPMFTQVEGLAVDQNISFSDLKGTIIGFIDYFFNQSVDVRFRPSYFPFTEPSAEVDIRFGKKGWLEILGCGMVHPNVLRNCNIDARKYRGFAFGVGVERLAMLYYGVEDIREFYASNSEFLNQI